MKLELKSKRIFFGKKYTISKFSINGKDFCDVIEDTVRQLGPNGEGKVFGQTAIPTGRYKVIIAPTSIKLWPEYISKFGQRLPLLVGVPFFERIRIHHGTDETNTEGCLVVGKNDIPGKVLHSRDTLAELMLILTANNVSEIWIEII